MTVGNAASFDQIDHSIAEHFRMDPQVFVIDKRTQDRIGNISDSFFRISNIKVNIFVMDSLRFPDKESHEFVN